MQDSLVLSGVGKTYGKTTALQPTHLTIKAGEFLTLLGPSGSGKTTLLMIIAGFVEPSSGHINVDGRNITSMGPEQRNFGVVFQGYALFPHMTVWDNVWFPLRARNISRKEARDRIEETLELLELTPYAQRKPKELSGGQQQRVALARALVFKPELLLLDEPLSALDKALRKTLQTELKALHQKVGTTFVYVTHDQEEALAMSDRIAILRDGAIQQIDSPEALYHAPQSAFVAGFLGRSNFFNGTILSESEDRIRLSTAFGEVTSTGRPTESIQKEALIAIRPELVSLATNPPDGTNRFQGTISSITFLGSHLDIEVQMEHTDVTLNVILALNQVGATNQYRNGAPVWVSWEADSTLLLNR